MPRSRIHRRGEGTAPRLLRCRAHEQLSEAKVAVRDERCHTDFLGEREARPS